MATVEKVKAGTVITHEREGRSAAFEIQTAHEGGQGHWHCVTHDTVLPSNMMKDFHIDHGQMHTMAWFCYEHGEYETP